MSTARPQFSIDDAFELSLEDAGPGPESSGIARFGPLHFERRARFEVADEDKQSRLRYQNLENDEDGAQASPEPDGGVSTRDSGRTSIRSSQWSFSTISNSTQRSYNACCSWTQHPLIQKNCRVVLASFLLLLLGLGPNHVEGCGWRSLPRRCPQLPPSPSRIHLCAVLILTGVGLEVAPSPGVSSAIFFVPGFLLLVPGVYHVIFIYCAVKGHRGFQFFYLPYFEK
ncbi:transmembrane protein 134 isoform X13 [Manis pentadactyla]|uniref:transmembrane protein 134 isoform X13 n=1 Tax=Manis pentadactyla TaxID=143292 RepID=UPI00255C83CA|nr:transmembrane protein 134 isoform X13 [Manis pentadactyla]